MGMCFSAGSLVAPIRPQDLIHGLWISSTEPRTDSTSGYLSGITGATGILTELEKLAPATSAVPTMSNDGTAPYPSRLRPLTDLNGLRGQLGYLLAIEFHAFDPTRSSGTGQDTATVSAIDTSRTAMEAYNQSPIYTGELGLHQPNWFRPRFLVNGIDLFASAQRTFFTTDNGADRSIGLPLPYCWQYPPIVVEDIASIEVHAITAQYIRETLKYQFYPILCYAVLARA